MGMGTPFDELLFSSGLVIFMQGAGVLISVVGLGWFMWASVAGLDFRMAMPMILLGGMLLGVPMVMPASPLLESAVPAEPMDWTWLWVALAWAWGWLLFVLEVGVALACLYGCYRLPRGLWAVWVWYVSPPPLWLARWLDRPAISYISPRQYRELERLAPARDAVDETDATLAYAARVGEWVDGHVFGRGRVLVMVLEETRRAV
jgi:hypothetical protein